MFKKVAYAKSTYKAGDTNPICIDVSYCCTLIIRLFFTVLNSRNTQTCIHCFVGLRMTNSMVQSDIKKL